MFCCCFLISGSFPTRQVWKQWLREGKQSVNFVVHVSNVSDDLKTRISKWCNQLGGTIVESVPTSWGGIGIVRAEGLLFDTASNVYPSSTHYWLVSETTIPCLSASVIEKRLKTSRFQSCSIFSPMTQSWIESSVNKQIVSKDWRPVTCSQFLIIHKHHWKIIVGIFWPWLNELSSLSWESISYSGVSVAPDEFVIQTLLQNLCHRQIRRQIVVADRVDSSGKHARPIDLSEVLNFVRDASNSPPLLFGARKVVKLSKDLIAVLTEEHVLQ